MLKLGYKASAEQFGPRELLDFSIEAERNGFDSVFISDHFQPWRHTHGHAPFSFSWLAAVGQRTERVLLGTSVATPTFRYHPAVVAHAFGTLGVLNPGRVILGVGTGEHLNEGALGIEWPEPKERFARLRESIRLIRQLWTEDLVTFEGEYYQTRNATIYDKPDQPVPIWVAANGPQTARYAGRSGDGFICTSGKGWDLYSETLLPAVKEGEELAHKPAGSVERMIEVKVSYDHDREQAFEDCKIWAALALPAEDKAGVDDPREMERRGAGGPDGPPRRRPIPGEPADPRAAAHPDPGRGQARLLAPRAGGHHGRRRHRGGRQPGPRLPLLRE